MEIDLLRGGRHTTAVPLELAVQSTEPFDYHVCVRHFDLRDEFDVYPIRLEASLPTLAIPLLSDAGPVLLDLQAIFNRCYDSGPFYREVRYAERTPVPPLRAEQQEWVNNLLRAKGLLPPA